MDRILKRFVAPESIQLKVGDEFCLFVVGLIFISFQVGAQVMLIKVSFFLFLSKVDLR